MIFPEIDPIAFQIGPFAVRWYALAYIVGIFSGWFLCKKMNAHESLWGNVRRPTAVDVDDLMLATTLGIILGGRIGYVLFYNPALYAADPLEIFALWDGGMSFHGGLIGCMLGLAVLAFMRKLNPLTLIDMICVGAPIGLFLGRLTNFINGELWGREAPDFAYAVIFPGAGNVPRHPSQLYEAFSEGILLFLIMLWAIKRFKLNRPGLISGIFAIGYATARIACEFFRQPDVQLGFLFGDSISFLEGGVTMGMLLSFPLMFIGIIVVILASKGKTNFCPSVPPSDATPLSSKP